MCSIILRLTSTLEDSCFHSSVPAEAVTLTIAFLNYLSFKSLCCLINSKLKSFKQCFSRNSVRCQKLQHMFEVQSLSFDTDLFNYKLAFMPIIYCPVDDTLFEIIQNQFRPPVLQVFCILRCNVYLYLRYILCTCYN